MNLPGLARDFVAHGGRQRTVDGRDHLDLGTAAAHHVARGEEGAGEEEADGGGALCRRARELRQRGRHEVAHGRGSHGGEPSGSVSLRF